MNHLSYLPILLMLFLLSGCAPNSTNQIAFRQEDSNQFGSLWLATSDGTHKYEPFNWLGFMFGSPKWLNQRELYVNVNESSTKWGDYILTDLEKGYLGCVTCEITGINTILEFAPSPKGDFLALADSTGIFISDKLGGDLTKILDVERPWNITWAPNEQYLAFMDYSVSSERHDLFKVERSGNNLTNITKDLPVLEAFSPSWSPIDDRIAFYFSDAEGFKVGIVNSDGSGFGKIADWHISSEFNGFDPTDSIPPQWSPDGRKLLFSSASESGEDLELFVVSADGSDLRNLTNSLHVDENWPVWSPDGRQIAFQSNRDENWEIYVINADGSNPINVSQSPETKDEFPAWRP